MITHEGVINYHSAILGREILYKTLLFISSSAFLSPQKRNTDLVFSKKCADPDFACFYWLIVVSQSLSLSSCNFSVAAGKSYTASFFKEALKLMILFPGRNVHNRSCYLLGHDYYYSSSDVRCRSNFAGTLGSEMKKWRNLASNNRITFITAMINLWKIQIY